MATTRRLKRLIIVESPSKARTIARYLGKGFTVKASMGHIKDLPVNRMGVDVSGDFEPEYVVIKGKEKVIEELKKAADEADEIYIASDPDREGEAIAWHIAQEIGEEGKVKRIIFHEITERAIKEALKSPTTIDMKKVNAQQARRVLDRIVGYSLSPLLWRRVDKGLSAGRVQSVALMLICEREKEIQSFVPEEYWKIEAVLKAGDGTFTASLFKVGEQKLERVPPDTVDELYEALRTRDYEVVKVERKKRRRNPPAPFITSTLQQEAFKRLGFSASKTMFIAQQLYEGVELPGEGPVGLITYMRTDSVRVSQEAIAALRAFIKDAFGGEYLPAKPTVHKSKGVSQDAHEAIRPTDVLRTPDSLKGKIPEDHLRLYELIWRRFVASQMRPAVFDATTLHVGAGDALFKATGSVLEFDGFMRVYSEETEDRLLPPVEEGQQLELVELKKSQHFTTPPPRYTEASLIKRLEEEGIGRPSTYATIVSTIIERGYVVREKKALVPTPLGMIVSEMLKRSFPGLMDVSFTARMEEDLDRIAQGERDWRESVREFYEAFSKELEDASQKMLNQEEFSPIKCEKCGRPMVVKKGRYGKFLACSGYPQCRNVKPLVTRQGRGKGGGKGKNKGHKKNS